MMRFCFAISGWMALAGFIRSPMRYQGFIGHRWRLVDCLRFQHAGFVFATIALYRRRPLLCRAKAYDLLLERCIASLRE